MYGVYVYMSVCVWCVCDIRCFPRCRLVYCNNERQAPLPGAFPVRLPGESLTGCSLDTLYTVTLYTVTLLYNHSIIYTCIYSHSIIYTCIYSHSIINTCIYSHSITYTCIYSHKVAITILYLVLPLYLHTHSCRYMTH